jgi:IgA Peptidase M64/Peptidase M64 N-terminus
MNKQRSFFSADLIWIGPILILFLWTGTGLAQEKSHFINKTLRVDYYHLADAVSEIFTLDHIYFQDQWSGNPGHHIIPFIIGNYAIKLYDLQSGNLIFHKSYNSYCGEYRVTPMAKSGQKRTFHESVLFPCPQQPVRFVLERRDEQNHFQPIWELVIRPDDQNIMPVNVTHDRTVQKIIDNGPAQEKVDIVILAEGYTHSEQVKFDQDVQRYMDLFLGWQPYHSLQDKFNIYSIFTPSWESGSDEPQRDIFRNTVLNSSFNTFGAAQYLLTEDNKTIRDIAAAIPYDVILILVNSPAYGGGGIYNTYAIITTDNPYSEYLLHHEFAHCLADLADEYYSSSDPYDDFYARGIEPVDPNITALLDPLHIKWADLLSPGIGIPTDWQQQTYDSLQTLRTQNWQTMTDTLADRQQKQVPADTLAIIRNKYIFRDTTLRNQINEFFHNHPLRGKIGVFEGAGYKNKGLFRPTLNSIMNRFMAEDKSFYAVNEAHIKKIIHYYCGDE